MMCEIPEKIAAIAPVAGYMLVNLLSVTPQSSNVSILIICGTADPFIPWNGGKIRFGDKELGEVLSARDTVDY